MPTALPDALERALDGLKPSGDEWVARCLLHTPDNDPSMTIKNLDGKILVHCQAGCDQDELVRAVSRLRGDSPTSREWMPGGGDVVAVYSYVDEKVQLLYQVLRSAAKDFKQRRPDPTKKSGWTWSLDQVHRVPFRLPELIAGVGKKKRVWIAEGEKDVLSLVAKGEVATCNSGGAGKWRPEFARYFAGAEVMIVQDKDAAGRKHAVQVMSNLTGVAATVTIVEPADPHKDISEHLNAGLDLDDLVVVSAATGDMVCIDASEPPHIAEPLYVDIAAFLDGDLPEAPRPTVCERTDGYCLFYEGQVNMLFGEPETGKTWVALAAVAEELLSGGVVLVIDLDHNGLASTVTRLMLLGVSTETIVNPALLRYAVPEDRDHLKKIVTDVRTWEPNLVIVDSLGELMPMLALGSSDADDFTTAHAAVLKPMAVAGATVIVIDHVAKNVLSRTFGPTGTAAKKRALGGVCLRVELVEAFAPGRGGSARLRVTKDRHGGVRAHCPAAGAGEPVAGLFVLVDTSGSLIWSIKADDAGDLCVATVPTNTDLAELMALDPPPNSQRDVKKRLRWGSDRATQALRGYREVCSGGAPGAEGATQPGGAPRSYTPVSGSAEQSEFPDLDETGLIAAPPSTAQPELPLRQDGERGPAEVPDATDAVEVIPSVSESHPPVVVIEGKRVCRECRKDRLHNQEAYDRGVCLSCFNTFTVLDSA